MRARFTVELLDDHDGTVSLKLVGSFDSRDMHMLSSSEFNPLVEKLRAINAKTIIVDLSETEWLGAQGLAFLVKLRHELAEQKVPIILRNPGSHLQNIFRIMQLEQIFIIERHDD